MRGRIAPAAAALFAATACASLPKGQYGVESIEWKGDEQMSRESIEACLATREREPWTIRLGFGSPQCGQPPFDVNVPDVGLWTWPWAEWPVYDPAIFAVDRERVVRWYQARGFYDARIEAIEYFVDGEQVSEPERCEGDDCALTIRVRLSEGKPVRVTHVAVEAQDGLEPRLIEALREVPELEPGQRFDEALYTEDKARLRARLRAASYARAEVTGEVLIDRELRTARVKYRLLPGTRYRFGRMRVEGQGDLAESAIVEVAGIEPGEPFSPSEIADAESAVYALGVFSFVRIVPEYREGSDVADLVIRVRRGEAERFRVGAGVMSGTLQHRGSGETFDVPQWDVHLLFGYSNENFLGGMRKLRIEERPRLILLDRFPGVPAGGPELGNAFSLRFEQPRFPERRTVSFADASWDYGPDPFYGYFRHDLATRIGVRRTFFRERLAIELALQHDLYEITSAQAPDTVSSYRLPFAEQQVLIDLRDDDLRPTRGALFGATVQEAVRLGYGSWNYVRVLPEVRAYQPLFWGMVLAERFAIGALFAMSADPALDPTSRELGPQNYRLRGGGASSNRGFAPGTLGAGIDGGKRRWEASLELRVPLGGDVGTALFFDVGDVSRGSSFRFDHWNASAGIGLRYFTSFAPIRLDAGWRLPGLAVLGEPGQAPLEPLPSAVHLTLGEAF